MTKIPDKKVATPEEMFERLQKWWQQQQQLAKLKVLEILERKEMVDFFFVDPSEGTNRLDLGGGFDLKYDLTYTRNVDEAAYDAAKTADFKKHNIDKDALFPLKPTLSVKAYRKLTDEQRAFVDELIDTKEGSPALHIVVRSQDEQTSTEVAAMTKRAPRKAAVKKAPVAPKAPKPPATKKAAAKKVAPKPPRK